MFKKATEHYLFYIILVGITAGFLAHKDDIRPKSITQRLGFFITGAISSVFMCWLAYEVAFFYTNTNNVSLAIGGFFAWRGAEWAQGVVDRWINAKIAQHQEYDEFNK